MESEDDKMKTLETNLSETGCQNRLNNGPFPIRKALSVFDTVHFLLDFPFSDISVFAL